MAQPGDSGQGRIAETFQARFERRWGHLTRPHVRALAWLLDAPDLLDPASALWGGQIASLEAPGADSIAWLAALERDSAALDAALGAPQFGAPRYFRLGLYAEKLLAFFFQHQGVLAAHGLQVRASRNHTVGEFDFLLRRGGTLLHWELATKFYLLAGPSAAGRLDCLVGPNLADTLELKIRKILDRQLALGHNPAAQILLPQAVDRAQALVKGWLFYPGGVVRPMAGIAPSHNHGFWSTHEQLAGLACGRWMIVPRLQWLAPLKARAGAPAFSRAGLEGQLAALFANSPAPLLVAAVREENGWLLETERGFIVPDDWPLRAAATLRQPAD